MWLRLGGVRTGYPVYPVMLMNQHAEYEGGSPSVCHTVKFFPTSKVSGKKLKDERVSLHARDRRGLGKRCHLHYALQKAELVDVEESSDD